MTNTLHRLGNKEALKRDYVLFATTTRAKNRDGAAPKLQAFLEIARRFKPVSMGNSKYANIWKADYQEIIDNMEDSGGATVVFDNLPALQGAIKALKEADLGISINVSGSIDDVHEACLSAGIVRHAVEHSLGVIGRREKLPPSSHMEIHTLCGHAMVSFNIIKKMIDYVKLGKLTPREAAEILAKPCECGAFNPKRAEEVLEQLRTQG